MTSLLYRRRGPHRFLCIALAALMPLSPFTAGAQQAAAPSQPVEISDAKTLLADPAPGAANPQPFELAYAVPNSFVYVAVRPAQVLRSPIAELYPTEVIQAAALQEVGLDPLDAESIVFSLAPTIGGPPSYSVFTRFNAPFQLRPNKLTEHTTPAEVAGKQYLQSTNPMLPSVCTLDDKSLLIAPDYFLRSLVSNDNAAPVNNLAAAFAAADQGDDLIAMVDVVPLRPLINMGLAQADIPPELVSLKQIPNLVKSVELRANFSHPAPSSIIVTANNEADADKLVATFEEMKQLVAAKIAVEAQKQLASKDPVEQAGGRYFLRMSRLMDNRLQLDRNGDQLVLVRSDLAGQGGNAMASTATVGVLLALLLPAVQAAREAARRNSAMNNMKQIMLALHNHEAAYSKLPAHANFDAAGKPLLSWRVHILPFLEQSAVYEKFHLDEPWDSEHNKTLISQMPEIYAHPNSNLPAAAGKAHFLGVKGPGYFLDGSANGRRFKDIEDGTSPTIAIVEVNDDNAAFWTKPDDWTPDAKDPAKGLGGLLAGDIFLAAFCDGHVSAVSKQVDAAQLRAMFTVAGGEAVPQF